MSKAIESSNTGIANDTDRGSKTGGMTRKEFLRNVRDLSVAGLVGSLAGSGLAIGARKMQTYTRQERERDLLEKYKPELEEIVKFRKKLGLPDLPKELQDFSETTSCDWKSEPPEYQSLVPEKNLSYSARNWEVIEGAFSTWNATRIIKGSRSDPAFPYGMSFSRGDRFCNLSDSVHDIPIETYTDYALHEACGHGSDPTVGAKYPLEVLIAVEHGKWHALSQAFDIPEQFLNHPGDLVYPNLKKEIGKAVAPFAKGVTSGSPVEKESEDKYRKILSDIANSRGVPLHELRFNKSVCRELGETLIRNLREGSVNFSPWLLEKYQSGLEDGLVEIYAEMFKYAVAYPEAIRNDADITNGIKEVCDAVSQTERPLEDIRRSILIPSPEIVDRNLREQEYLSSLTTNQGSVETIALTSEEQERIKKQEEEFRERERLFEEFCKGKIPERVQKLDSGGEINRYARLYAKVVEKYPMLKDTFAQQYDESFDPNLDWWEITSIERAVDTGFVRGALLELCPENPNLLTDQQLTERISCLENFINSTAF